MRHDPAAPVALVGLSGAGKSAVAPLLAARLGVACRDLDARIEAEAGATVRELFQREGEAGFRRREERALARAIEAGTGVIACGGGAVLSEASRELLRRCRTIWLEVAPAEAARRLDKVDDRPLLQGAEASARLAALLEEREARYAEVAEARIPTDGRSPEDVADAVRAALDGAGA